MWFYKTVKQSTQTIAPYLQLHSLIILLMAIISTFVAAQNSVVVEPVGKESGFLQRNIKTIYQDSRHFLWIGTSDGLYRYDGYDFRAFRFDPFNAGSISGNDIRTIDEGKNGELWITTTGSGINRFDPITQTFQYFQHQADDSGSISDDDVTAVLADTTGEVWLGTDGGGLNIYHPTKKKFSHIMYTDFRENSLSSNRVSSVLKDSNGNLWVGTYGGGINYLRFSENSAKPDFPGYTVRHFLAEGNVYEQSFIHALLAELRKHKEIAKITRPENGKTQFVRFTITSPTKVLITAMGSEAQNGLGDYGWIENEEEQTVWEMNPGKTAFVSENSIGKLQIDAIRLLPGNYILHYTRSADGFIPKTFEERQLSGIRIFPANTDLIKFWKTEAKFFHRKGLLSNWINDIYQDDDGNLWAVTPKGVSRIVNSERVDAVVEHIFLPGNRQSNVLQPQQLAAGEFAGQDGVWILNRSGELFFYSNSDGQIRPISLPDRQTSQGTNITAIDVEQGRKLWIGTNSNSLFCLNLPEAAAGSELQFDHFNIDDTAEMSGAPPVISVLFRDHTGVMWIGTQNFGLHKLNRSRQPFHHISPATAASNGLNHPEVTAILSISPNTIWVGTYGGGINILTRTSATGHTFSYQYLTKENSNLQSNLITALYRDQMGKIWVGTHGAGIALAEVPDDGNVQFHHFTHNPLKNNSITGNNVNAIYEDQYGQIWIGTNSGLNQFDRLTNRFTRYQHNSAIPASLSDNEIWVITEDTYNNGNALWIGTKNGGLNKFNRQKNNFIHYYPDPENPHSLNSPAVLSIYEDSRNRLWIGTYGGGLNLFDHESEKFSYFTEREGLANNLIFTILEDWRNHLWLSTNKGLSMFMIDDKRFRNFDISDGLQVNEFKPGASEKLANGELWFGSVNGITFFQPDSITNNPHPPAIQFLHLTVMGKDHTGRLMEAAMLKHPLRLSYTEDIVSIEFSALDFNNPSKNRYAYKLEGLHQDWIDNGNRRYVNFINLPTGSYRLWVTGSNNDGLWNQQGIYVDLVVLPPFWQTWWFISLAVVLLSAIAWVVTNWRIKQRLQHLLEIEQIRQQESEKVRAKAAHDFHDELGHKLTKIALFSEIIKRRMPDAAPEISEYLQRIQDTSKSLSGGMRDFIWTLDPNKDSLYEVLIRLKDFGDELFDKTGISFSVTGLEESFQNIRMSTDMRRHITLIFKEAMNNALKHSGAGNIVLSVNTSNDLLIIELIDDGKGMENLSVNGAPVNDGQPLPTDFRGNGLRNMALRAQKIEADIYLVANQPNGTIVKLITKIP